MKKLPILLLILITIVGCKNDKKKDNTLDDQTNQTDVVQLTGNFIYYADAAVFQTKSELYGVVDNEKTMDLIIQAEPLKNESTDEVVATLKVRITKKPENEEGWENRIEIIEIIKVSKASQNDNSIIKFGKENNAENQ